MLNQIPNIEDIFEGNHESKFIQKYKNEKYNIKFFDYKDVTIAPEHYIYQTLIRPNPGFPLIPTQKGEVYRYKIPDVDFMTGLSIKCRISSGDDNTGLTSYNTAANLWNKVTIYQYGKIIFTFDPTYVLSRIMDAPTPAENEALTALITSQPLDTNSVTYDLPFFAPFLENCKEYLFLEFYKGLEVEIEWKGLALTGVTLVTPYLALYRMRTDQDYKNSVLHELPKTNFIRPWYNVRTLKNDVTGTSTSLYLDNFYVAKNIYLFIMGTDGQEINIDRVELTIGSDMMFIEDRVSNFLKKYYSPERFIPWGFDASGVSIPFGLLLERFGFTGGLSLVKGPFLLKVYYDLPDADVRTLYTNIEYYSEVGTDPNLGLLISAQVY